MKFKEIDLKIKKIQPRILSSPYGKGISLGQPKGVKSIGLVEVITNSKLKGLGETYSGIYMPEAVNKIFSLLNDFFVDQNISNIDLAKPLLDIPFVGRSGLINSCLCAVNIALWDIIGKYYNLPVYKLLDKNYRSSVSVYASGGSAIFNNDEVSKDIDKILNNNFYAYKMRVGFQNWKADLQRVEIARKKLNKKKLMVDAIMGTIKPSWNVNEATKKINELETFSPYWIEEPLHPNNIKGLKRLKKNINIPIAVGEAYSGIIDFEHLNMINGYDILQIDATHSGGLFFCKDLIRKAVKNKKQIALHVWGSAAAIAANLHLAFSDKNIKFCEFPTVELAISNDIWISKPKIIKGKIKTNNLPGLGIRLPINSDKKYSFVKKSGYNLK